MSDHTAFAARAPFFCVAFNLENVMRGDHVCTFQELPVLQIFVCSGNFITNGFIKDLSLSELKLETRYGTAANDSLHIAETCCSDDCSE